MKLSPVLKIEYSRAVIRRAVELNIIDRVRGRGHSIGYRYVSAERQHLLESDSAYNVGFGASGKSRHERQDCNESFNALAKEERAGND